jgi:hypothetical protein
MLLVLFLTWTPSIVGSVPAIAKGQDDSSVTATGRSPARFEGSVGDDHRPQFLSTVIRLVRKDSHV